MRPPKPEPVVRLAGRQDEYRRLVAILADSVDGVGHAVLVLGEAGIGKTHLLTEVGRIAADHGFRVLHGRASGAEGQVGYQIWIEALRPVIAEATDLPPPWPDVLASLFPDIAVSASGTPGVAPQFERARLFEAVTRLLARLGEQAPVVLLLDDLHWADADSLHLLHYVARTLRRSRVSVIGAARPRRTMDRGQGWAFARLLSSQNFVEIELGSLDEEGVAELLIQAGLASAQARQLAPSITGWTAGNPFFVLEGLRALEAHGTLRRSADGRLTWAHGESAGEFVLPELPRDVREAVLRSMDTLPDETRRLLNVAAVLGTVFLPDLLASVVGWDELDALEALAPALEARLLVDRVIDGRAELGFAHDLVREATYQQQPAVLRAAIEHWLAAGQRASKAFAFDEALRAYEAALASLGEQEIERRAAVLEAIGDTQLRRGAVDQAIAAYDAALALLSDSDETEPRMRLHVRIALACGRHYGNHPRAREFGESAVAYYSARGPSPELARALLGLASTQHQANRPESARRAAREALILARQLDLPREEAVAWHIDTWSAWLAGEVTAIPDPAAVERLVARLGEDDEVSHLRCITARGLRFRGDLLGALESAAAAVEAARRVGSLWSQLLALEVLAGISRDLGQLKQAEEAAREADTIAGRLQVGPHGISEVARRVLVEVAALRGDVETAITRAQEFLVLTSERPSGEPPLHLSGRDGVIRALLLLNRLDVLLAAHAALFERPICRGCQLEWLAVEGYRLAVGDEPERALRIADELQQAATPIQAGLLLARLSLIRALALRRLGCISDADHAASEARRRSREIGDAWGQAILDRV